VLELVVFLGNPGPRYEHNRHNVGRLFAERLPFYSRLSWQKKYRGLYAPADTGILAPLVVEPRDTPQGPARKLHFLEPETFMNLSGESVAAAAGFFKFAPESILAVHDELELPLGVVSLKAGGGLGGHNGLRSMKASLGSADFWRLRFGIGRPDDRAPGQGGPPGSGKGIIDWVLSDFSPGEEEALEEIFPQAAAVLIQALLQGPETLLPAWGKKMVLGS
jgi:PTH1 family peptidyl-tRNA hydrolase